MTADIRVSIVGGSGYGGGELLRLLLRHPRVELAQIISQSQAGQFIHSVHPNLRPTYGETPLRFTSPDALEPCDVMFLAQPHGAAQTAIERYASLAERIIDLSADFRLQSAENYAQTYGHPHAAPEWLARFAYGLPEANRAAIRERALRQRCGLQRDGGDPVIAAAGARRDAERRTSGDCGRESRLFRSRGIAERGLAPPGAQRGRPLFCANRTPA